MGLLDGTGGVAAAARGDGDGCGAAQESAASVVVSSDRAMA